MTEGTGELYIKHSRRGRPGRDFSGMGRTESGGRGERCGIALPKSVIRKRANK